MAADYNSPGTPSRHEKSLGLLTAKFVSLLQEAKDGVLDLKVVKYLTYVLFSLYIILCYEFTLKALVLVVLVIHI